MHGDPGPSTAWSSSAVAIAKGVDGVLFKALLRTSDGYWRMRMIIIAFVASLVAGALGGCSEEPQELAAADEAGFKTDSWADQLRERTLRQGESRRIYH